MEEITAEELRMDNTLVQCRVDSRTGKDVPLTDVITRHVKQVADFNKALEKRQLWREREKELKAKRNDSWGVLQSERQKSRRSQSPGPGAVFSSAKRVLDAVHVEGVDSEVVEQVKEKVARKFGSMDVHAAIRQRVAKQKEKRQIQMQNETQDIWAPDRFYTEELKQKTPWLNPVEFLSDLQPHQREGSLTPVAVSESDGDSKKRKKAKKTKKDKKKKKHKREKKKLKKSRKD